MDFSTLKYVLGTKNEAKVKAVRLATGADPLCMSVPSGISDQPLSEEETIRGAVNRAKAALTEAGEGYIGLGLEGGLAYDDLFTQQWYLVSVCAAWDGTQLSLGKGLAFPMPNEAVERIKREDVELRTVIDEWSGTTGSNHRGGAYGLITGGRIQRAEVFRDAVIAALAPFVSPFYRETT
ncbi:inosine/xanthosine triphosphatase [Brevibacillus ruminantium]|uniref:inosine/xanthosine triphosphatase n=1 Tax=Brevibacillus ruminantium TaxID=2950604 RepID=A0ABY4WKE2_9BACL|nr:inosine/xanthosine triphosphatase [Brevibacillus ruminantium]USG67231.1 inosine/xanthosine triphosphatase [Brevibacillus ruminantium]